MSSGTSEGERGYLAECASKGCRLDGRDLLSFRQVVTHLDVIPQATSSARVVLGKTDVLVGLKVELDEPAADLPDCGKIEFFVDYAPCGTQDIEEGDAEQIGNELSDRLSRLWKINRKTKKSGGLDMTKLCILEGKSCFVIFVDATVLNVDGNLLGAISIATAAALQRLAIPRVEVSFEEGMDVPEIEIDEEQTTDFDATNCPVVVTVGRVNIASCLIASLVGQIKGVLMLDMTAAEESTADCFLHTAVDRQGRMYSSESICRKPVTSDVVVEMMTAAKKAGGDIHSSLSSFLTDRMEVQLA